MAVDKKIFIDPGHGGSDPGAVGNALLEAVLNLKIANYMRDFLIKNYVGHEIKMSRTDNTTVELGERDDLADNWGADVYVSIHINSATKPTAKGFETFVYSTPNAKTVSLQNIVHAEILTAMKKFGDIVDRGKKRGNLSVLRETNMAAILTENLFIINSSDASKLKNEDFLKAVGEAHGLGVAKYLGLPAKPVRKPAEAKKKYSYSFHFTEGSSGMKAFEKFMNDNGFLYNKKEV